MSPTARDERIFVDLYRHRVLSVPWLARAHFGGSLEAAWVRLRKLARARYVEQVPTTHGAHKGYRLMAAGRRLIGVAKRPRRLAEGGLGWHAAHTMTVAEVAAYLSGRAPTGWSAVWLTEQELCDGAGDGWLPPGGLPDGVLELRNAQGDLHRLAVEVELHDKRPPRYATRLAWYKGLLAAGGVQRVRWYVPNGLVAGAVQRALRAAGLAEGEGEGEGAEVRLLDPAAVTVYGSARCTPTGGQPARAVRVA
ncbi:MAG TPA: replication-relaxation family protein [Chloroflexota bacterium]|nr:replication-relaxation family protein [Chloroflexota bacterium]